ncbi:MAG: aldo/keto reductase [Thermoguttaceae bacterium]
MHSTTLPRTDLRISRVAMGCWALAGDATWGPQDEAAGIAGIRAALDAGINLFDTAELYGNGKSETLLGKALRGRRDEAVIASKFSPEHAEAGQVAAACERSLECLQTDHLDLYQVHWPSRAIGWEETWRAMESLRDAGKIRYLGVSNFGARDLQAQLEIGPPTSNQLPYNLVMRSIEYEILPWCLEHEVGVLCYSPLQHGLLTGKFRTADDVPEGRARSRHFSCRRRLTRHGEPGCEQQTFAAIDRLREIAAELGRSASDVAMAWLLARRGVSSVVVGIRDAQQARANAAATELRLDEAIVAALDRASEPVKEALGANPDMWEGEEKSRYR